MSATPVQIPAQYIPAHVNPAHLRPTTRPDLLADWPCAWTHYIDASVAHVGTYRHAVACVEEHAPEATGHLDHLRAMRDIALDSACFNASRGMRVTYTDGPHARPIGPVQQISPR